MLASADASYRSVPFAVVILTMSKAPDNVTLPAPLSPVPASAPPSANLHVHTRVDAFCLVNSKTPCLTAAAEVLCPSNPAVKVPVVAPLVVSDDPKYPVVAATPPVPALSLTTDTPFVEPAINETTIYVAQDGIPVKSPEVWPLSEIGVPMAGASSSRSSTLVSSPVMPSATLPCILEARALAERTNGPKSLFLGRKNLMKSIVFATISS